MNSTKKSRLFAMAVLPMLAAGLFLVLQTNIDDNMTRVPISPGIITPDGMGSLGTEPFSIVPGDRETKIEYRNI